MDVDKLGKMTKKLWTILYFSRPVCLRAGNVVHRLILFGPSKPDRWTAHVTPPWLNHLQQSASDAGLDSGSKTETEPSREGPEDCTLGQSIRRHIDHWYTVGWWDNEMLSRDSLSSSSASNVTSPLIIALVTAWRSQITSVTWLSQSDENEGKHEKSWQWSSENWKRQSELRMVLRLWTLWLT